MQIHITLSLTNRTSILQLMADAVFHDSKFWIDVNVIPGSDQPKNLVLNQLLENNRAVYLVDEGYKASSGIYETWQGIDRGSSLNQLTGRLSNLPGVFYRSIPTLLGIMN